MAGSAIEVAAAVTVHQDKVLLAQRFGGELDGLWEFPGGKFDPGESWAQAILREMFEELHLEVSVQSRLAVIEHEYPAKRVRLHFVHCTLIPGNAPEEIRGIPEGITRWFKPSELLRQHLCPADRIAVSHIPWKKLVQESSG